MVKSISQSERHAHKDSLSFFFLCGLVILVLSSDSLGVLIIFPSFQFCTGLRKMSYWRFSRFRRCKFRSVLGVEAPCCKYGVCISQEEPDAGPPKVSFSLFFNNLKVSSSMFQNELKKNKLGDKMFIYAPRHPFDYISILDRSIHVRNIIY